MSRPCAVYATSARLFETRLEPWAGVGLKEVTKKAEYRFTVKTSERELKLRAGTKEEYDAWQAALKPVVDAFGLLSTEDDD